MSSPNPYQTVTTLEKKLAATTDAFETRIAALEEGSAEGSGVLRASQNLADVADAATARTNLGITLSNYVQNSALTSTLANYVQTSALTSALTSYVQSSSLASTLADYVQSTTLTSTLSGYVQSSGLSATLASYVTSSALTTALSGYVQNSTLSSTLANYVLTSTLSSYVQTNDSRLTDVRRGVQAQFTKPDLALRETIPRYGAAHNSSSTLTSTNAQGWLIVLEAGDVISSITWLRGTTDLTGGTNQWFWLADVNGNLLRVTNDDTTTAWTQNTAKTLTLTSTYTVSARAAFYIGITIVATTPGPLASVGGNSGVATLTPMTGFRDTAHTLSNPASAPSTFTKNTVVSSTAYGYVS